MPKRKRSSKRKRKQKEKYYPPIIKAPKYRPKKLPKKKIARRAECKCLKKTKSKDYKWCLCKFHYEGDVFVGVVPRLGVGGRRPEEKEEE